MIVTTKMSNVSWSNCQGSSHNSMDKSNQEIRRNVKRRQLWQP
jgi:hypothetical protein